MHLMRSYSLHLYSITLLLWCASSHGESIHIAVASNFTHTMKALIAEYEQNSPYKIKASYGSSGKIYAQIKHGAPFELFFSADQSKPLALYREGLTYSKPFTYALGGLALWSNNKHFNDENLESVLLSGEFNKLAIANPKLAPYGIAAMEVLENLNLVEATRKKWVKGESIAQTYQFVATGNADLGFVSISQIIRQAFYWKVPSHLYQPIRQDAVLLKHKGKKNSSKNNATLSFIKFLHSPKSQAIIQSFGYHTENNT